MHHFLIAQIVGAVAVIIALSVYQFNNRKLMLRLNAVAAFLYAISFYMLGARTGAAMNLIGSGRCFVFTKVAPSRKNIWVLFIFILISIIGTALTWQGNVSLLAIGGSIFSAIAFWQRDPKTIRVLALLIPPLWFSYDALSGSYPGMFVEAFNLVSILIGRYRFDKKVIKARA
ncbi:MAG TPA: YgjV family protein [Candidatus Saccharimonadales bacterium]